MNINKSVGSTDSLSGVVVSRDDARMIQTIHNIVDHGKNAEVKRDKNGKLKVLKVTKEIA